MTNKKITWKKDRGKLGLLQPLANLPDFSGPIVQGPPNGRFIYIDIGSYAGVAGAAWNRRLKIPLTGITPQMMKGLLAGAAMQLETKVPGTGKDGITNCATVKPFSGWYLSGTAAKSKII